MNVTDLQDYFKTHNNSIKRGATETAKRTHSSVKDVLEARRIFKKGLNKAVKPASKFPKILIFDIETAPIKAYVWKVWKENVALDQILDDWFIICWSAKWIYSNEVMGECLTSQEIKEENDERVVKKLWKLFDEADIIIAHNVEKFDAPKMNVRFLHYGLVPPAPYRMIDTFQVVKKQFRFTSNKLDALADFFNLPRKLETDFTLWKECLEGKTAALQYMFKYNKYDVELLEEVYLKLLPWIHNHPNLGNYINSNKEICSNCGSAHLIPLQDHYYKTQIGTYQLYRCKDCGAISRGRVNIGNRTKLVSIAR